MAGPLVLVLGGTRSGKSRYGLQRATALADGRPVAYLATAGPGDPELDERIASHRAVRPSDWPTVDVGTDLPKAVERAGGAVGRDGVILLDGLTLWLSALMRPTVGTERDDVPPESLEGAIEVGLDALLGHPGPRVVVSDEIGLGIVPLDSATRRFRDLLGLAHQRLAAAADEAYLLVAGLPVALKAP